MTDNTMREGKLWAFLRDSIHGAYKKLSTTGTSNEYHALLDSIASKVADDVDARFLQAAQSEQSVPVVGEAVAYLVPCQTMTGDVDMKLSFEPYGAFVGHSVGERVPLYAEPPTSITQAELDAKDARIRDLESAIEHMRNTLKKLDSYRLCMSYNDSYFSEPPGLIKRTCRELSHCIDAAMQERQS